jgi:hypothetical protein
MSVRMDGKTDHFTAADWKALVANGVTILNPGLVEVLTSAFTAAPECSTIEDVVEHGFAIDHLVHNVAGLPIDDDRKMPAEGTVQREFYIDPAVGLGSIIKSRLGGRYDGAVQTNLVPKGKFLVATKVWREYTSKTTGITSKHEVQVWAVAVSADLIDRLVLEPEVKRAWSASMHAANNANARMTAVPESAPMVLAALDAGIVASNSARATAYAKAIEGKTPEEVKALDAAISDLTDTKVTSHLAAITSGSGESQDDA